MIKGSGADADSGLSRATIRRSTLVSLCTHATHRLGSAERARCVPVSRVTRRLPDPGVTNSFHPRDVLSYLGVSLLHSPPEHRHYWTSYVSLRDSLVTPELH